MPSLSGDLPILRCPKRSLGPVSANPQSTHWLDLPPIPLCENVSGDVPSQATWFKVAWNEEELRVLFWIEDTYVWYTMTERNSHIYEEEVVEVFLDPGGKLESYYEFEVNPVNTVLDLVIRRSGENYEPDFNWHCQGLRTATQRTPQGWCAEFSFPFASLGGKPNNRWRANFYRIDRPDRVEEVLSAWSPTGKPKFHVPERFGVLEFVE